MLDYIWPKINWIVKGRTFGWPNRAAQIFLRPLGRTFIFNLPFWNKISSHFWAHRLIMRRNVRSIHDVETIEMSPSFKRRSIVMIQHGPTSPPVIRAHNRCRVMLATSNADHWPATSRYCCPIPMYEWIKLRNLITTTSARFWLLMAKKKNTPKIIYIINNSP